LIDAGATLFNGITPLAYDEIARSQGEYLAAPIGRIAQTEKAESAWLSDIRVVTFNSGPRRSKKADSKIRAVPVVRKLDPELFLHVEEFLSRIGQFDPIAHRRKYISSRAPADAQFVDALPKKGSDRYVERLLPIVGDFVPSLRLVSLWKDNLVALENDVNTSHRFLIPGRDSLTVLQGEFKTVFEKALASFANRARFQKISELELINNLSFTPTAEFALIDRLYLVPSRSGPVLGTLAREFANYLHRHGSISAIWGELHPTKRGISYSLLAPSSKETVKRVRAKVIK